MVQASCHEIETEIYHLLVVPLHSVVQLRGNRGRKSFYSQLKFYGNEHRTFLPSRKTGGDTFFPLVLSSLNTYPPAFNESSYRHCFLLNTKNIFRYLKVFMKIFFYSIYFLNRFIYYICIYIII